MRIQSFKKIVAPYKVVMFDSFGVIKNASGIIDGVDEILDYIQSEGKKSIVLTNDSSRSAAKLAESYSKHGLTYFGAEDFVSSGMLASNFLATRIKTGLIAYLGTEDSAAQLSDLGLKVKNAKDIDFNSGDLDKLSALVFLDDEGYEWRETLNIVYNILRQTAIPVIVANSDHTYPSDVDNLAIAVGSLADMLESITGQYFIRFGKPDVQIFQHAFNHVNQNGAYSMGDVLMVGDTLKTDIIGANKFGIDSALVLTGNTIPDQAKYLIKTLGIIPKYICESITT